MTNKPMALAKTRQKIGLKLITITDFCPLTEVNGNEESIQPIFKQLLRIKN